MNIESATVAVNSGSKCVIAGWLHLILTQLYLILARQAHLVALNPGSKRSLLLVWRDLIAGRYSYAITFLVYQRPIMMLNLCWGGLAQKPTQQGFQLACCPFSPF